jgi:hypothetical protein
MDAKGKALKAKLSAPIGAAPEVLVNVSVAVKGRAK